MNNIINSALIMSQSAWGAKQARERLNGLNLTKTNMSSADVLKLYVQHHILSESVALTELAYQIESGVKAQTPTFGKIALRELFHTAWNKTLPEFKLESNNLNKRIGKDVLAAVYNDAVDNCGRNLIVTDFYSQLLDNWVNSVSELNEIFGS